MSRNECPHCGGAGGCCCEHRIGPLYEAMQEAASIVCDRIAQFGHGSRSAYEAHDRWRAAWIAWRDSPEAEES